ncbi:MAG: NUDIX hydrolase [Termitinemataceae bacterium]|nr:MAG: NUDIX hydrolase [Termitinemataceae bacterium]
MDNDTNDNQLVWTRLSKKTLLKTSVFTVCETESRSPLGACGNYTVMEGPDCAVIIPVIETEAGKRFIMVKQWRHGSNCLSVEFPGGVIEKGEDPSIGAARELLEETGYKAGKIEQLGLMNPNPAIMENKVYYFLAQDLKKIGDQDLDNDEFVGIEFAEPEKVMQEMGKCPYIHTFMAAALCLYYAKYCLN